MMIAALQMIFLRLSKMRFILNRSILFIINSLNTERVFSSEKVCVFFSFQFEVRKGFTVNVSLSGLCMTCRLTVSPPQQRLDQVYHTLLLALSSQQASIDKGRLTTY